MPNLSKCAKLRGIPRTSMQKEVRSLLGYYGLEIVSLNLKGDRGMANVFVQCMDGESLCEGHMLVPGFSEWWEQVSAMAFNTPGTVVPAVNPKGKNENGALGHQQDKRAESPAVLVLVFDASGKPAAASEVLVEEVLKAVQCVTGCTGAITVLMRCKPRRRTKGDSGGEVYVEMPSIADAQHLVDNELLDAYRVDVNGVTYYLHAVQRLEKDKLYVNQRGVIVRQHNGGGTPPLPTENFVSWSAVPEEHSGTGCTSLGYFDEYSQEAASGSEETYTPVSPLSSTWCHNPYMG